MDSSPSQTNNTNQQGPEAELLKPRIDSSSPPVTPEKPAGGQVPAKPAHRTYRPSHKATFIGLAVVLLILGINAVVLTFLLRKQAQSDIEKKGQVTISSEQLSQLGINRTNLGAAGVELLVAPDAQFKGKLAVAGTANIGGQVVLNSRLTGTEANLTQLQAGNTSLTQLNVNGSSTVSTLNVRQDLVVAGQSQLQGPVTLSQLLTLNNNANIKGNLAVGGTLSANNVSAGTLVSTNILTIGGHIVTSGPTPSVSGGGALGSNGTVSISGNDAAGAVGINIGAGAVGGTLATVNFRSSYGTVPKVVITSVGVGASFYLSSISSGSFSIAVSSGLPPGGYRVNYIVMQ